MATLKPRITKSQFAAKFRATFPDWTVEVTPTELMALSNGPITRETVDDVLRRLTSLASGQEVLISAQLRAGRTVVTVDLRSLPQE